MKYQGRIGAVDASHLIIKCVQDIEEVIRKKLDQYVNAHASIGVILKMRCKRCKKICRYPQQSKCWREYSLCGACAWIEHPEIFPKNINGKIYKIRADNK